MRTDRPQLAVLLGKLAGSTGLDPAASGVTGRRQLRATPTQPSESQTRTPGIRASLGRNCGLLVAVHGQKTDSRPRRFMGYWPGLWGNRERPHQALAMK